MILFDKILIHAQAIKILSVIEKHVTFIHLDKTKRNVRKYYTKIPRYIMSCYYTCQLIQNENLIDVKNLTYDIFPIIFIVHIQ